MNDPEGERSWKRGCDPAMAVPGAMRALPAVSADDTGLSEQQPAALILRIATVNLWNRLDAATRQVASAACG
ncbi:hypothetical protein AB0B45_11275 [Nonomuraea sp. NPDC049152]|uniref:hypothetical protein n=1 Tax=Nonomuraea sp. NPDC049152 TaxID=3154350 RepID=UPI0033C87015